MLGHYPVADARSKYDDQAPPIVGEHPVAGATGYAFVNGTSSEGAQAMYCPPMVGVIRPTDALHKPTTNKKAPVAPFYLPPDHAARGSQRLPSSFRSNPTDCLPSMLQAFLHNHMITVTTAS